MPRFFRTLLSATLAPALGCLGLGLGATLLPLKSAQAAEDFTIRATGPLVFTLSLDSLETYAKTGQATGNFRLLARFLNDQALTGLRKILTFQFR
ncbi:MAG TPA: alpha/beta hydrolase, partial [Leptolyngbyaceae cyanobacterium M65_K2018_010]|nr:alpha/beta hydrolase [Leptolyngbyaceae cyanobacterium M65_K2018_010]